MQIYFTKSEKVKVLQGLGYEIREVTAWNVDRFDDVQHDTDTQTVALKHPDDYARVAEDGTAHVNSIEGYISVDAKFARELDAVLKQIVLERFEAKYQ